jgi:hypothetical protein
VRLERGVLPGHVAADHRSEQREQQLERTSWTKVEVALELRTVAGRGERVGDRQVGVPLASKAGSEGRSYLVIVTSYAVPPLTIAKRDPGPTGSGLGNSARLTRPGAAQLTGGRT